MKQLFKLQEKIEKLKLQRDKARAEVQRLRTVQVTQDPPAEYEIKEMHIDCEKKDFEVGKWYKLLATESTVVRFHGSRGTGYDAFEHEWTDSVFTGGFENWRLATPEEIKEVLTKRCKELGLFDGEFECLTGDTFRSTSINEVVYWEKSDKLWIGGNIAYEKGKFAELVDNKTK